MSVLAPKALVQSLESSAAHSRRLVAQIIAQLFATNFIIQFCFDCMKRMSSIPQAAYATTKIRANNQMNYKALEEDFTRSVVTEHPPAKYNSNFMKSIWNQYNRYSVHNLKKITGDASANVVFEASKNIEASKSPKGTSRVGPKANLSSWSNLTTFETLLYS